MLALVEFPELVQHDAPYFETVFSPAAWIEFQRYIRGLIVSENKTVDGIKRLFVRESRHQRSLNRLLTESPLALADLNRARLAVLESVPQTKVKARGVLSVDDTLVTHVGTHFEHIASRYDHAEGR
ncbi:MAG: transposase [Ardenticatenaceae bacterium]|nr:transposase [Ardenticatenaceae bacterium]